MNVQEFYERGKKVFDMATINALVPGIISQTDEDVLNIFFQERFGPCELQTEDELKNQTYSAYEVLMKKEFYKAILDAISQDFDTLSPTSITETETNSGADTDATEGTNTTSSQDMPNITTTDSEVAFDGTTYKDTNKTTQQGSSNNMTDTTIENTNTKTYGHTINRTRAGKENIDYRKAIEDMYETKRINFYDILMNNVASIICILYYFVD